MKSISKFFKDALAVGTLLGIAIMFFITLFYSKGHSAKDDPIALCGDPNHAPIYAKDGHSLCEQPNPRVQRAR